MSGLEPPKYQLIAADLRARIAEHEWEPGARLPAQQQLADAYGVTLMTLRQAVAALERDGLVRAERGRGTFVAPAPFVYPVGNLWSFTEEMASQGIELTTEVLSVDHPPRGRGDAGVRSALGLPDDADVVEVVRRRSHRGRPLVVQRSTTSAELWSTVVGVDLTAVSLYDALAERSGHRVERAVETLRAVALDEPDAVLLDRPAGSPAMLSIRSSIGADDEPFLVDRALLPGDALEIRADRHADRLQLGYHAT